MNKLYTKLDMKMTPTKIEKNDSKGIPSTNAWPCGRPSARCGSATRHISIHILVPNCGDMHHLSTKMNKIVFS